MQRVVRARRKAPTSQPDDPTAVVSCHRINGAPAPRIDGHPERNQHPYEDDTTSKRRSYATVAFTMDSRHRMYARPKNVRLRLVTYWYGSSTGTTIQPSTRFAQQSWQH